MEYTNLQDKKISARDLIIGATYLNKKQESLVYIGRHEYNKVGRYSGVSGDPGSLYVTVIVSPPHIS